MSGAVAGNAAAFVAAFLFGASVVATREAVQALPPLVLAFLRFGEGALVLFAVLVLARRPLVIARRDLPTLALLGALYFTLFPVTFNAALDLTTASRGAVMLATMPIWSALFARLLGREYLTPRQFAGVLLSFLGVAIVFFENGLGFGDDAETVAGNSLMLVAAACGAWYGVLAKPLLVRNPPVLVTAYGMAIGTLLLFPLSLAQDLPAKVAAIDAKTAALVLFLGVLGAAVAQFLITFALARLSPTQAAVYINLNPVVATALAALLLDERITGAFALGFATILLGLLLVNLRRAAPRPAPLVAQAP